MTNWAEQETGADGQADKTRNVVDLEAFHQLRPMGFNCFYA